MRTEHHHKRHKIDFADAKKHRVRERVEQLFLKLNQHDPLFPLAKDMMAHHFERLPASGQRALQRMFSRCPHETLAFYKEIREAAEKVLGIYHGRRKTRNN